MSTPPHTHTHTHTPSPPKLSGTMVYIERYKASLLFLDIYMKRRHLHEKELSIDWLPYYDGRLWTKHIFFFFQPKSIFFLLLH